MAKQKRHEEHIDYSTKQGKVILILIQLLLD